MDETSFSTQEAARLCGVDRRSMLRWVKAGLLDSHQTGGGRHRIGATSLVAFMRERGMPIPDSLQDNTPRVVIVDDDPRHVAAVRRLVVASRPHALVESASDGFSGGLLVAEVRPHLLLLDLVMPGLDGIEVCRRIKANPSLKATSIVVLSGRLEPSSVARLGELGVTRCLAKPIRPADLQAVFANTLPGPAAAG